MRNFLEHVFYRTPPVATSRSDFIILVLMVSNVPWKFYYALYRPETNREEKYKSYRSMLLSTFISEEALMGAWSLFLAIL